VELKAEEIGLAFALQDRFLFFFKDFINLFERESEQERERAQVGGRGRGRGRSGFPVKWGAQHGAQSRDPEIMT